MTVEDPKTTESFVIFQVIPTSIAKKPYILVIFGGGGGGGVWTPAFLNKKLF